MKKKEYAALKEAVTNACGYVDGTCEPDGFAYEGAGIYDLQKKKWLRKYGYFPVND